MPHGTGGSEIVGQRRKSEAMTSDMGKRNNCESEFNMVYCMAFGCTNDSRNTKNISYHKLPDNNELKKVWLVKISREDPKISKNSVLCSEHFEQDCFERDLKAELLGTKRKAKLKSGAIPNIFSHRVPEKKRRLTSERRQKEKEKTEVRISDKVFSVCVPV